MPIRDHILSFMIKLAWRAKTDLFVSNKTIGADLILGPWYKHEILVVILHSNEQQTVDVAGRCLCRKLVKELRKKER